MKPTKKAVALAFGLTAASVISQYARGQEVLETPSVHDSRQSNIKSAQPLIMMQSDSSRGVTSTLIVDCKTPKTYLTLKGVNGGTDIYSFDKEGVPTVDATPPKGVNPTPELKASVITKMMRELGQRQLEDLSPDNLCRDGRPNTGATLAILNFVTRGVREFDL